MKAKLLEIRKALPERRHVPIPEMRRWLAQVVTGYFAYHAVPTNSPALHAFRYHVVILWIGSFAGAARERTWCGSRWRNWSTNTSQRPVSSSLAECAVRRQKPEVGAVCGNSARMDLCGGGQR